VSVFDPDAAARQRSQAPDITTSVALPSLMLHMAGSRLMWLMWLTPPCRARDQDSFVVNGMYKQPGDELIEGAHSDLAKCQPRATEPACW
jgi:hypothetical protein